ncbi:imidazole glycerol phosphate synthase subunit HisH [Synechococcus sp. M16CYN]|uniref:imidazole glycerol phosphate synthase subunit HisH n=1 Tax=Synechococcus sp. M16CYN TaxID=3103139 RepID=UPI0032438751
MMSSRLSRRLGIVDYGVGNLHSVGKALERLGEPAVLVQSHNDLVGLEALILPGVGSFGPAMDSLYSTGLVPYLRAWGEANRPILGICLGLQLLFEYSAEDEKEGLGIFQGSVERLPHQIDERVPHMGWAPLRVRRSCPLLSDDGAAPWVYFVHSYVAVPRNAAVLAATVNYGTSTVTAVVWSGRVGACQFHPEKSSSAGEAILKRWLHWLYQSAGSYL